ncbi:hypothetical protein NDU88_002051 [Pleurodeles waltl]|uniref:Uncharacterized protein n=1 Tax=Pleurodeles waltl TaxID=8319 RepID=A0AAV7UUF7_PLEWA|nr:hypothetical protein NDU88_002051 [Pleurodeles waltl]
MLKWTAVARQLLRKRAQAVMTVLLHTNMNVQAEDTMGSDKNVSRLAAAEALFNEVEADQRAKRHEEEELNKVEEEEEDQKEASENQGMTHKEYRQEVNY